MTRHVVLAATRAQQPGASLRLGGLTVVERAIRQLARTPNTRLIVASDGSIPLPPALPPNVEVQTVPDAGAVSSLAGSLGAPVVDADVVRVGGGSDKEIRVTDGDSRRVVEDAIYATMFRPDLGFVARRLNKPISVRLTRYLLANSPITPNQITLVAAAFGVLGCLAVATGHYGWIVAGFVLEQIQSVLDGCDGELARVRFEQSKLGAWLDTFVDDVLNVLMTGAAGIGLYRAGGGDWAAAVGIGGAGMLVASNLIIMRDMRRQRASGDLMDMVWWFSGGRKLGESIGNPDSVPKSSRDGLDRAEPGLTHARPASDGRPGIGTILFQMGRRDTAIFLWLIFALCGQLVLVVVMATIIALAWFVASVVQLVVAPPAAAQ